MTEDPKKTPLPQGILLLDLKYPGFEEQADLEYEDRAFDLWFTTGFGWCKAGTIRDRISTKRAKGQMFRAAGRTSWNWNEEV